MKLGFVAIFLVLCAERVSAATPTILGWTAHGIAIARLPSPCSQCEVEPEPKLHAADSTGVDLVMEDVPALTKHLVAGTVPTQPTLDGKPVAVSVSEVVDSSEPGSERASAMRVTATRDGKQVASTVVRSDLMHRIEASTVGDMSLSPDGHRLALAIEYQSGIGDARGFAFSLVVLGPAPKGLPDGAAARNDIVDVRHGRAVSYVRVKGWTADGVVVVEAAETSELADHKTELSRGLYIDDGTQETSLSNGEATWDAAIKPAVRITQSEASFLIKNESFGLELLPALKPSSTARAPAIRATADRVKRTIILSVGKKVLRTEDRVNYIPDHVHVRSVALSPDGHRAVVIVEWTDDPDDPRLRARVLVEAFVVTL